MNIRILAAPCLRENLLLAFIKLEFDFCAYKFNWSTNVPDGELLAIHQNSFTVFSL